MPDPFAYIPLNTKIGGNKKKAAGKFKEIIKASQKNADVNMKGSGGKSGMKKGNKKHK